MKLIVADDEEYTREGLTELIPKCWKTWSKDRGGYREWRIPGRCGHISDGRLCTKGQK